MKVLDQFEIENTSTYESGSYDQVVMGRMLNVTMIPGWGYRYSAGRRGVAFGSVNSSQAKQAGDGSFDVSTSNSYRLQPHSERAGNVRAAKHICTSERYYDSLPPDFWACLKINGASICVVDSWDQAPGYGEGYNGLKRENVGFIIFDNYLTQPGPSDGRVRLNRCVDRFWTKSFPYEPRYSEVKRQKNINYLRSAPRATFRIGFESDGAPLTPSANVVSISPRKIDKVFFGIVGPQSIGSYQTPETNVKNWRHYWAADVYTEDNAGGYSITGAIEPIDAAKVLYGFGDVNSTFFTSSYGPNNRLGTSNFPDFRAKFVTENLQVSPSNYELVTGSSWCVSPVIRGWKYGLYSALPSYTSAYFRQGKYGQFRDMLEQRQYTKLFIENQVEKLPLGKNVVQQDVTIGSSAVTVKFLDQNGNLTNPENTQSNNLSFEATSSLPYFDLEFRNVSKDSKVTNLSLVSYNIVNGTTVEI